MHVAIIVNCKKGKHKASTYYPLMVSLDPVWMQAMWSVYEILQQTLAISIHSCMYSFLPQDKQSV